MRGQRLFHKSATANYHLAWFRIIATERIPSFLHFPCRFFPSSPRYDPTTEGVLKQIDIHVSPRFRQQNLEPTEVSRRANLPLPSTFVA